MKKSIFILAILFTVSLLKSQCNWTPVGNNDTSMVSNSICGDDDLSFDPSGTAYAIYADGKVGLKATVKKYMAGAWSYVGSPAISTGSVDYVSISTNGAGVPYVAFTDAGNSSKVSVMTYSGSAWVNVGAPGISSGAAKYNSLAIDASGIIYLAYMDVANSNKANVVKYTGSSWVNVGPVGLSVGTASFVALKLDASGTPYIVYRDGANSAKATVQKYNGSSWTVVGTAGFTGGGAKYTSLAIDPSGNPAIAYSDSIASNKATCMSFNGSTWSITGTAGFSSNPIGITDLEIDASGNYYIAYNNIFGSNNKIVVRKYSGSTWTDMGLISGGNVMSFWYLSLALNNSGLPMVLFNDVIQGNTLNAFSYNGTMWNNIGCPGVSAVSTRDNCIAIDPVSGQPYVSYQDISNGNKLSVVRYTGSAWVNVGPPGFTAGSIYWNTHIAFNPVTNEPWVAYTTGTNNLVCVVKYNGSWSQVGTFTMTSSSGGYEPSIAFNSSGTPYCSYVNAVYQYTAGAWVQLGSLIPNVYGCKRKGLMINSSGTPFLAYTDALSSYSITVKSYNGSTWNNLPATNTSTANTWYSSTISNQDTIYIMYAQYAGQLSVKKFNGTSWVQVGSPLFTPWVVSYPDIAIDNTGTPYIVYNYYGSTGKCYVMAFNGSSWVTVGGPVSNGVPAFNSIAIDNTGMPYVAYSEYGTYVKTLCKLSTGVVENDYKNKESNFSVFPNPNNGQFTVELKTNSGKATATLYNIFGKKIKETVFDQSNRIEINTTSLAHGIYFITVSNGTNSETQKIIVE